MTDIVVVADVDEGYQASHQIATIKPSQPSKSQPSQTNPLHSSTNQKLSDCLLSEIQEIENHKEDPTERLVVHPQIEESELFEVFTGKKQSQPKTKTQSRPLSRTELSPYSIPQKSESHFKAVSLRSDGIFASLKESRHRKKEEFEACHPGKYKKYKEQKHQQKKETDLGSVSSQRPSLNPTQRTSASQKHFRIKRKGKSIYDKVPGLINFGLDYDTRDNQIWVQKPEEITDFEGCSFGPGFKKIVEHSSLDKSISFKDKSSVVLTDRKLSYLQKYCVRSLDCRMTLLREGETTPYEMMT